MKKYLILILLLTIVLTACQQKPIGGDRDENGCLSAAGYSFDENVGACTRSWEFDNHEKEVARNVLMVQSYSSFTIVSIEKIADCQDCYDVTLQRNPIDEETMKEENLEPYVVPYREGRIDYSYDNQISNFEECVSAGNPVMESYPRKCRDSVTDTTFTEVIQIENGSVVCGNNICEEGEANREGGCGPDADPRCLGPPAYAGTCPEDCKFTNCLLEQRNVDACDDLYEPVCATVNIQCFTTPCNPIKETFNNICNACSNELVEGYTKGECENKQFVICKNTLTGFDPKEYAQSNNGICVEICPEEFDTFTTQTGIQLCILHYGITEIEQWNTCDKSTDICKCAKAYETTDEQQIPDAEYRCVPDMYAERLLFRGGFDSLDENGEQSVMIA